MNRIVNTRFAQAVTLLLLCLFGSSATQAQSTAFTYQGKLTDAGNPATGNYDLQFRLFDALVGGTQAGSTVIREDVQVTSGIFTVSLDFGAAAFPGANRWMEIGVRPGVSAGAFTTLAPLQLLTATPYAIKSLSAEIATTATSADALSAACVGCVTSTRLADASVSSAKIVDVAGSKVTGMIPVAGVPAGSTNYIQNSAILQASSNFNISGNGMLGGALIANTLTSAALRQELTVYAPNLINGFLGTGNGGATPGNRVTAGVVGASIGGGGFNGALNYPSGGNLIAADYSNRVTDWFGTIGGGFKNRAGNDDATLDNAFFATVGGGFSNTASGSVATVGGGDTNTASGLAATVGGGIFNTASGSYATVSGGRNNTAGATSSFAAGNGAKALHQGAFVWADFTAAGDFASTADHQFLIRASGGVGINKTTPLDALDVAGNIRVGTGTTGCVKDADGTAIAGTCSSDLRFKKEITPMAKLLAKLAQLQPVNFYWRAAEFPQKHFGTRQSYGLIAQDVEAVLPELVTLDEQGYRAVNYSKLPLLTIQAVKELKAENDALKEQLATQGAQLKQQRQQLDGLKKLVCQTNPQAAACQE